MTDYRSHGSGMEGAEGTRITQDISNPNSWTNLTMGPDQIMRWGSVPLWLCHCLLLDRIYLTTLQQGSH